MDLIILSSKDKEELEMRLNTAEKRKSTNDKMCIVIDGSTLAIVLENTERS
jgi:hypothetical protein